MRRSASSTPTSVRDQRRQAQRQHTQRQQRQAPGGRLPWQRSQSMLGEFWNVPEPKSARRSGPVQTTIPMWDRVLSSRVSEGSSSSRTQRRAQQPPRISDQAPLLVDEDGQLIESDSSCDIECTVAESPQRRTAQKTQPSSSRRRVVNAKSPSKPSGTSINMQPAAAPRSTRRKAEQIVLDGDEDVVEVNDTQQGATGEGEVLVIADLDVPKLVNTAHTTPRRSRKRRADDAAPIPSSPAILHASSPTIRRFNIRNSQPVTLVDCTQETVNNRSDTAHVSQSSDGSDIFSGDTLNEMPGLPPHQTGGSYEQDPAAAEDDSATDTVGWIPETPRQSRAKVADPSVSLGLALSSDPISDFCSPVASPRLPLPTISDQLEHRPALSAAGSDPISTEQDPTTLAEADAETDDSANASITQWYHLNLEKCHNEEEEGEGEEEGKEEDGESDVVFGNAYSGSDASAAGAQGSSSSNSGHDDGDGYSSPLEGFWDLRNATQSTSNERDMYYNQFRPTARQLANQQRKAANEPRNAASAPFQAASSMLPAAALIPRSTRRAQRAGPAGRGRRHKRRRGSSARPAPRPRTARAASAGQPAPSFATYNHYADDPFLDIEASLNWEGSGLSRFG